MDVSYLSVSNYDCRNNSMTSSMTNGSKYLALKWASLCKTIILAVKIFRLEGSFIIDGKHFRGLLINS